MQQTDRLQELFPLGHRTNAQGISKELMVSGLPASDDPRLAAIRHCKQCGACTTHCPAYLDTGYGMNGNSYLPRSIVDAVRTQRPVSADIRACTQCYTCEMACQHGVSPGAAVNALYEAGNERWIFKYLIERSGMLPPLTFLICYTRGADALNYMNKYFFHRQKVSRKAIAEVRHLFSGKNGHMIRSLVPHRPAAPPRTRIESVYLTRSCCNFNFPGDHHSLQHILEGCGIGVYTSDEQSCCGGAPYYMGGLGYADRQLLCGRNFSVIHETMGNDDVINIGGICPTCFDSYSACNTVLASPENRGQINRVLEGIGRELPPMDQTRLFHSIDLFSAHEGAIKNQVELNLRGLKVGVHLSCHYRNRRRSPEAFTDMKDLVRITGAKVVENGLEGYCCGGVKNLFDRYLSGRRDSPSLLMREKRRRLYGSGADIMVVDCPGCQLVFDQNGVPALHIGQLLALAAGADPDRTVGVGQGTTSVKHILMNRGFL